MIKKVPQSQFFFLMLVYRLMSVFLVNCIQHLIPELTSFESAGFNSFTFFFKSHCTIPSSLLQKNEDIIVFFVFLLLLLLMLKNVSFYSNAVANIFIRNGCGYLVTLLEEVCHWLFARKDFFLFFFL